MVCAKPYPVALIYNPVWMNLVPISEAMSIIRVPAEGQILAERYVGDTCIFLNILHCCSPYEIIILRYIIYICAVYIAIEHLKEMYVFPSI